MTKHYKRFSKEKSQELSFPALAAEFWVPVAGFFTTWSRIVAGTLITSLLPLMS
jgi:L-asparagine transporter-like permease